MENKISPTKAVILLIVGFAVLFGGFVGLKAPNTITLIFSGLSIMLLASLWGVAWKDIMKDVMGSLHNMFPSILIVLFVGMLVASWISSGTIPVMVYYGLKILRPRTFLVVATLICCVMSVTTGTSWGTMSTVGVALMGISVGLGIPLAYTAGAVLVGAIFGDKLSPLSDTTVLASAVAEADIVDHIKYMLWTTIPGLLISLILFYFLGRNATGVVEGESLNLILDTLNANFNLSPLLIIPPVVVLVLIAMNKPTIPVFAIGITLGVLCTLIFQGGSLAVVAEALNSGYATESGVAVVDKMLMRGGLSSMYSTVGLLIASALFGSPLKTAGVINVLIDLVKKVARSGRSILAGTYVLHLFMMLVTGAYYVTFSAFGPMLKPLFNQYNLAGVNLSRCLEDSGTAIACLIPWSVFAAFTVSTLGVPVMDYFLFAPLTYLSPVIGILYAVLGFKLKRIDTSKGWEAVSDDM